MTPDNYGNAILDLIGGAKVSLFMQYSYVPGPKANDLYRDLLKAVADRMMRGVDVRVIVDSRNETDEDVDLVLALGWDGSRWRRQTSAVHNRVLSLTAKGQSSAVRTGLATGHRSTAMRA